MTAPDRSSTGLLAQADAIRKLHVEPWEEEDREHIARRVAAIALAGARPAAGPDAEHERMDDQVLRERDEALDAADALAGMVAPSTIVGEHSNSNEPWQNAMGYAGGPWGSREARHGPWCSQAVAAARPAGDDTAAVPPLSCTRCGGEIEVETTTSGYYRETEVLGITCEGYMGPDYRPGCGARWGALGIPKETRR